MKKVILRKSVELLVALTIGMILFYLISRLFWDWYGKTGDLTLDFSNHLTNSRELGSRFP
jgi:hypothetical protein